MYSEELTLNNSIAWVPVTSLMYRLSLLSKSSCRALSRSRTPPRAIPLMTLRKSLRGATLPLWRSLPLLRAVSLSARVRCSLPQFRKLTIW